MRKFIPLLFLAACTTPAHADWQVQTFTDRMTDRQGTYALLSPRTGAATLRVRCMNGNIYPDIVYPQRVAVYEVGASIRFDNGYVEPRITRLSDGGRSLMLWTTSQGEVATIRRSKRFRIQVGSDFSDFDLTGADAAIGKVKCR